VLGFINLQAQGIKQELLNSGVETTAAKIDKLVDAAQSAHEEIREYIRNARSLASSEKNFSTALTKIIKFFEKQTGLNVEFKIPNGFTGEELEPNVRLNVLNIVKEAFNNIEKHAEADQVKIVFSLAKKLLCVTVEDNGKGFNNGRQNYGTKTNFGLNIMRERASEIGVKLDIQSALGIGTRIDFCVPFKEETKNANEIVAC